MHYLGSVLKNCGDRAYRLGMFSAAAKHYEEAAQSYRYQIACERHASAEYSYDLACALSDSCKANAMRIKEVKLPEDLAVLKQYIATYNATYSELESIVTLTLDSKYKTEFANRLQAAQRMAYENVSIVYWNYAVYLSEKPMTGWYEVGSAYLEILDYLELSENAYRVYVAITPGNWRDALNQFTDFKITTLHSLGELCTKIASDPELDDAVLNKLRISYPGQISNEVTMVTARMRYLEQAVDCNQQELALRKQLFPGSYDLNLHQEYIKLRRKMFDLDGDKKHLDAADSYSRKHKLTGIKHQFHKMPATTKNNNPSSSNSMNMQ